MPVMAYRVSQIQSHISVSQNRSISPDFHFKFLLTLSWIIRMIIQDNVRKRAELEVWVDEAATALFPRYSQTPGRSRRSRAETLTNVPVFSNKVGRYIIVGISRAYSLPQAQLYARVTLTWHNSTTWHKHKHDKARDRVSRLNSRWQAPGSGIVVVGKLWAKLGIFTLLLVKI